HQSRRRAYLCSQRSRRCAYGFSDRLYDSTLEQPRARTLARSLERGTVFIRVEGHEPNHKPQIRRLDMTSNSGKFQIRAFCVAAACALLSGFLTVSLPLAAQTKDPGAVKSTSGKLAVVAGPVNAKKGEASPDAQSTQGSSAAADSGASRLAKDTPSGTS